jgi:hypothetical protein
MPNSHSPDDDVNGTAAEGRPAKSPTSPITSHAYESPSDSETSPVTSPPYWAYTRHRSPSNVSIGSTLPGGITLQDNTEDGNDKNGACWARSVHIHDHVVVNGSRTGIGAFVVWNITVKTLDVGDKITSMI